MYSTVLVVLILVKASKSNDCSGLRGVGVSYRDRRISSSRMTASSVYHSTYHEASDGRLHYSSSSYGRGWRPANHDSNPWLRIDIGEAKMLGGIETQGSGYYSYWVTNYAIKYSNQSDLASAVSTTEQTFEGNYNYYSVAERRFTPITARFIWIFPKSWYRYPVMRVEILECYRVLACDRSPCRNGGTCLLLDIVANTYNCTCRYGYLGYNCEITEMIKSFELVEIPPKEYNKAFPVIWTMKYGINVTVNASHNGMHCCSAGPLTTQQGQCNCSISNPYYGTVNILVTAANRVSGPVTRSLTVEVQKKIKDPSFTMLTTYSQFGSGVTGIGPESNIYPVEYAVLLNGSYTDGPVTTSKWLFTCPGFSVPTVTGNPVEKNFPKSRMVCNVTWSPRNGIDRKEIVHTINLYQSITLKSVRTSNGPVKINQTMTFTISLGSLGTGTCMWVDLGDNSSLLVFGNQYCPSEVDVDLINPNIIAEPRLIYTFKHEDTQRITINHLYQQIGVYNVRVNGSNILSTASHEMVAVVLPYICKNPNVTVKGHSPDPTNALGAAQVYRSFDINFITTKEIFCEKTEETKTAWTILKLEDDPRTLPSNVPLADIRRSEFHSVNDSTELTLPGRFLPYGFYEIRARVEMRGLKDVFGTDSTFLEIIQTPWLEPVVKGGSLHTVPFGFVGILNSSESSDPDSGGMDGMTVVWYCKDKDDTDFNEQDLSNEPIVSEHDIVDETLPEGEPLEETLPLGCFGSGRGRINTTNTSLVLDTKKMVEDKMYEIWLVISTAHPEYGLRQAIAPIYFRVALGVPPELSTLCYKNCRSRVIPDEKLILLSECSKYCEGELTFGWSLYLFDDVNQREPFNLSSLNEIPPAELQGIASNPINELDIAIKPHSLSIGKKYIFAFRAIRPSGVYGELRTTVIVNSPPVGGECRVSPLVGVALSTNFTFTCDKWVDDQSPLTYELSYGGDKSKTIFAYYTGLSGVDASVTSWLVAGDESKNYTLTVAFTVKDSLGSRAAVQYVDVEVLPNEEVDVNQLSSKFDDLLASGDTSAGLGMASAIAATINVNVNASSINGTGAENGVESSDAEDQGKVIEHVLTSLSGIVPKDVTGVMQFSGALAQMTANPDKLTSNATDATLSITENLADSLKQLSDDDAGFENIKSGAGNVVNVLGGMISSSSGGGNALSSANSSQTTANVNRTLNVIQNLHSTILNNLVANEEPYTIESENLSLQVEKKTAKALGGTTNKLKDCSFKLPSGDAFGLTGILSNRNDTMLQMQPVDIKVSLFKDNPFSWSNASSKISPNVIDIVIESNLNITTSNMSEEIAITIDRDPGAFGEDTSFFLKPDEMNSTIYTRDYLKFHCFTRTSNYTAMNFELKPHNPGINYNVYLKKDGKPDLKAQDYDFLYQLPHFGRCNLGDVNISDSKSVHIDASNCSTQPYTVFVSNLDFNGTGKYCFAVQHTEQFHNETYPNPDSTFNSRSRRAAPCEVGAKRVRRSCVMIRPAPPKPTDAPRGKIVVLSADNLGFDGEFFYPNQTPNYNLTMFESSCLFWDVANETWKGDGCRVDAATNRKQILCHCNHLTSFGSDLLVAPNPIDFDSVFQNFGSLAENVAVLALISTILGVYIIGAIWARRADRRDDLLVGPTVLKQRGSCYYIVTTDTGNRQDAGTTARVVFTMSGDQGETLPVWLHDRERPCFERGQRNTFVVSYPAGVGDLSYVQIWHDNSGSSPSWYLSRLYVKDVQTGKSWILNCENWLAVESDDGKVCRILSISNDEELTTFNHVFSKQAVKGLMDGHIWFSVVTRPPASNFTRVQRLSCALCLLCCTMITSAMFYNMGGQGPSPFAVHIGSLVIDLKPFVIGLQSSVIIVPVNVLIVQIFRNLRPKTNKVGVDCDRENAGTAPNIQVENQSPPQGKLPHCFIFFAYALCYLASAASIFFTLLYSIQWGKETSTEWVIAMVSSFFQSVLLLQPVKVVLIAIIIALCAKKAADTKDNSDDDLVIKKSNAAEQKSSADKAMELQKKIQAIGAPPRKLNKFYSPPRPEKLKKARDKRLKEIKSKAALKEIFAFFLFLVFLIDVAYYHRDSNTFFLTKTLYEMFEEVDAYSLDLSAVSDGDSLWMLSRETLIPGLYSTKWYNEKKIEEGWLKNNEDYLVGVPRVRLLRVQQDSCQISSYFEDSIPHCYDGYTISNEDVITYDVGWEPLSHGNSRKRRDIQGPETENEWTKLLSSYNNSMKIRHKRGLDPIMGGLSGKKRRKKKRLLASGSPKQYVVNDNALLPNGKVLSCLGRWRHQSMGDLRGFPYWGTLTMYSGSGYVANLGYDPISAYTVVADLHSNGWIDIQTRAVFIEFTVYNANTNLFGILSYFIEFGPSSTAVTRSQYQAARFYIHLNGAETLSHVLVIFFMLYFLYREGKLVYEERLAYFKGFWNWIEVILIISEFLLIVFFLVRLYEIDRNIHQLRENPNDYVGFQYAANADELMTYVIGILVFFYTLRFLRLLRFNKNFLVIGKTLSRISSPILSFCLPFISGFFAFAMLAFTMFGTELEDYSSFVRTMVTQFSMTLGDFDFEAIFMVNPTVATIYFFSFIALNVMVLMNMFIAIINDSYAEIQEETSEIENELEIIEYVTANVTGFVSSKFHRGKVVPERKKKKKRKRKSKKLAPFEELSNELDVRGNKLEIAVEIFEKSMAQDEEEEKKICAVPKDKQDTFFRVICLMETVVEEDELLSSDDEYSGESTDEAPSDIESGGKLSDERVGVSGDSAESDDESDLE